MKKRIILTTMIILVALIAVVTFSINSNVDTNVEEEGKELLWIYLLEHTDQVVGDYRPDKVLVNLDISGYYIEELDLSKAEVRMKPFLLSGLRSDKWSTFDFYIEVEVPFENANKLGSVTLDVEKDTMNVLAFGISGGSK